MSNEYRGEVTLKAGEKTYTARIGMNELANLEQAFGVKGLEAIKDRIATRSPTDLRAFMRIALTKSHQDLSEADVGDIMDDIGLRVSFDALARCLAIAVNGPTRTEAGAGDGPKSKRQTATS